jgi:uncharacterized protein
MKLRLALLALALGAAMPAHAADGVPLFNAALSIGRDHRFVLVNVKGESSGFLAIGQSFAGYTIKAYDAKAAALDLERDGKVTRVTLVADAKVQHKDAAPARATLADAEAVLGAMRFEEMMEKTMAGVRKQQSAMVDRMMAQMPMQSGTDREAAAAFQKKMIDEIMSAMNFSEMKGEVAKIYSETFTKDQLAALGAFYQSPAGQAFSDKQPEIATKMNELMTPRIMAVMPKVQQMAKQFAEEQKAKKAAAGAAKQ